MYPASTAAPSFCFSVQAMPSSTNSRSPRRIGADLGTDVRNRRRAPLSGSWMPHCYCLFDQVEHVIK